MNAGACVYLQIGIQDSGWNCTLRSLLDKLDLNFPVYGPASMAVSIISHRD